VLLEELEYEVDGWEKDLSAAAASASVHLVETKLMWTLTRRVLCSSFSSRGGGLIEVAVA